MNKFIYIDVKEINNVIKNIKTELNVLNVKSEYINLELDILNDVIEKGLRIEKYLIKSNFKTIDTAYELDVYATIIFNAWGKDKNVLFTKKRDKEILVYRQIFHYVIRFCFEKYFPLRVIGEYTMNQNHASVLNSCQTIQDYIDSNDKNVINLILKALEALELEGVIETVKPN